MDTLTEWGDSFSVFECSNRVSKEDVDKLLKPTDVVNLTDSEPEDEATPGMIGSEVCSVCICVGGRTPVVLRFGVL